MKACTKCGASKPLDAFSHDRSRADGRFPWCKECGRADAKRRYAVNPEPAKARAQAYSRTHRAEITARNRAKRHARPEVMAAGREASRRWKQNNREAWREQKRRNALRGRVGRGRLEVEYATVLCSDPCSYCGGPAGHIDHIDAVDSGGPNHWSNFTAACQSCNSSKNTKPLLTYLLGA